MGRWYKISLVLRATLSFASFIARRKIALLIGVSTLLFETKDRNGHILKNLRGPISDIQKMKNLLINRFDFSEDNVIVMTDENNTNPDLLPTESNILFQLRKFTMGCKPGDKFVFYYSGHSDQRKNLDGRERDGLDELIVTHDSERIVDDDLHKLIIEPLQPQTSLIAILDTCHAQSLLDLDHHICNDVCGRRSRFRRAIRLLSEKLTKRWNHPTTSTSVESPERRQTHGSIVSTAANKIPKFCSGLCQRYNSLDHPSVVCISACKDGQTASDDPELSMTSALVDFLDENHDPTLKELMRGVSDKMRTKNIEAFENYQRKLEKHRKREKHAERRGIIESLTIRAGIIAPSLMMNIHAPKSEPQLSSPRPLFMNSRLSLW